MLYLITKPLPLYAGEYHVEQIDSQSAANLIRSNSESSQLKSLIHFGSTAVAMRSLTSLNIELVERAETPTLNDGDQAIEIRLRANVGKGQKIGLADLEFFLIRYRSSYEAKHNAPGIWPAVLR